MRDRGDPAGSETTGVRGHRVQVGRELLARVGSHLARLEMRIAVEEFLRRVPDFRLAPGPDPGWYAAGPLVLEWDVATANGAAR